MQHTTAEQDDWAERVGHLRRHLRAISEQWDEMLNPTAPVPGGGSGGALDDDHELTAFATHYEAALASAPDVPRIDIVADVRAATTAILNGWCRAIIEDHDVEHGIPSGGDVPGMCTFLGRWADQCLEHEAADDLTAEIAAACAAVGRCARPSRPEGMAIGECRTHLGDGVECGTVVRATPDAVERGEVRCRGCGTTDTVDGWLLRMVGTEGPYTAAQLIPVLHRRLGIRATPDGIRQWVRRGIIEPMRDHEGRPVTRDGRSLFGWRHVARRLTEHRVGQQASPARAPRVARDAPAEPHRRAARLLGLDPDRVLWPGITLERDRVDGDRVTLRHLGLSPRGTSTTGTFGDVADVVIPLDEAEAQEVARALDDARGVAS